MGAPFTWLKAILGTTRKQRTSSLVLLLVIVSCCWATESAAAKAAAAVLTAGQVQIKFTMVADLDLASRDQGGKTWSSYLKRGVLEQGPDGNFTARWTDPIVQVSTEFGRNNRGMELSELVMFNGQLVTVCDYTGIVYNVNGRMWPAVKARRDGAVVVTSPAGNASTLATADDGLGSAGALPAGDADADADTDAATAALENDAAGVRPPLVGAAAVGAADVLAAQPIGVTGDDRAPDHTTAVPVAILSGGNGRSAKPFKSEWATVKDGELIIGSTGTEWVDTASGAVLNRDPEWVKVIGRDGAVTHRDWGPVYRQLRLLTNTTAPGYMWHEAVDFDPEARRWVFLPRKASTGQRYHPLTDEQMGANKLIRCSEDFGECGVVEVGDKQPDFGFTAVRKLPGSFESAARGGPDATGGKKQLYLALKAREVGDETATVLAVFDGDGRFYSSPQWIPTGDAFKYEGLELV